MLAITVSATDTSKKAELWHCTCIFLASLKKKCQQLGIVDDCYEKLIQSNKLVKSNRGAESALQTMLASHLNRKNFRVIAIWATVGR